MCGLGILSPRNLKYSRVTIIQNRRDARILFELSGVLANMTRDNIPPCVVMKHLHIFDNTTFTHTSKDGSPAFARAELAEGHLCRFHTCRAYPACSFFFFFLLSSSTTSGCWRTQFCFDMCMQVIVFICGC